MFKFENGAGVEDKITGLRGVITGRVDYLTGCRQYLVQPHVQDDGKYIEAHWFDESRLEEDRMGRTFNPEAFAVPERQGQGIHPSPGADQPAPVK